MPFRKLFDLYRDHVLLVLNEARCGRVDGAVYACQGAEACGGLQTVVRLSKLQVEASSVVFCVNCKTWFARQIGSLFVKVNLLKKLDLPQLVWLEDLRLSQLAAWSETTFEIHVVTTCRSTLVELLSDLKRAHYFGDEVELVIHLEAHASDSCVHLVDDFSWIHGPKRVQQRISPSSGPHVAIPEALSSSKVHDGHYLLLFEDDIGVSNQFYSWLKFISLQLQDISTSSHIDIFGISLYTPRVLETGIKSRESFELEGMGVSVGTPFVFEVPCSWGSAFKSQKWHEAMSYFKKRFQGIQVYPPLRGSRVNGWQGSWKKWMIELAHVKREYTLYPHFHNQTSFSTNKLGQGEHIRTVTDEMRFNYTVPLHDSKSWYSRELALSLRQKLRAIDIYGRVRDPNVSNNS